MDHTVNSCWCGDPQTIDHTVNSCSCGDPQTMDHTVDSCLLTEFKSGLSILHKAEDDAVNWLNSVATQWRTHTPPFNGLFSRTTWVSRYQKGKTCLDLNEASNDGVFLGAVASAGPYANNLHLAPDR